MRANNTKGMKVAIMNWITPKGQTLNLHISCNVKSGQGFHHECTGALLCPAGYEWQNSQCVSDSCYKKVLTQYLCRIKEKLHSRQLQVTGDQWPIFLYTNYMYDPKDPCNRLLYSGLLVCVCIASIVQ